MINVLENEGNSSLDNGHSVDGDIFTFQLTGRNFFFILLNEIIHDFIIRLLVIKMSQSMWHFRKTTQTDIKSIEILSKKSKQIFIQ